MILNCYAKIISVDIEQHGSKDATPGKANPLFPPPALFAIQLNIEASVFQKQLDSALSY